MRDDRLIWFLAGLGLGAAGAVLAAPSSGRETRARLRSGAEAAGGYVKQRADALSESGAELVAQGTQAWNDTVSKGKDAVTGLKEKLKGSIDDGSVAAKLAADKVVEKSKDFAHEAGRSMERGGKRLQEV